MSRRGEMTGGFLDIKRSRLELYSIVQQMHARKVEFEVLFYGEMELFLKHNDFSDISNYLNYTKTVQEALEKAVHASNDKASNVEKLRMEVDTLEREVLYLKFVFYSLLFYYLK